MRGAAALIGGDNMKDDGPATVGEAVRLLNEKHLHPSHHLFFVRMDLLPEKMMALDTIHNVMKQSFDWRFGGVPDKAEYTLTLSADDMRYIGNALEVYHTAMFGLYLKPQLEAMCKAMTGMSLEDARKQAYGDTNK